MKWVFMFQFNWYEEGYFCEKIIVDDYLMIKTINKAFNNNNSSSSNFYLMFRIYQHYFGEGKGNPLQYSCLENLVDGGAWWAAVHRVTQSQTQLKRLSMHTCIGEGNAIHSSILAWRIPGTEEPGGLPSIGLERTKGT